MKIYLPMTINHEGVVARARYLGMTNGVRMLCMTYPEMEVHTAISIMKGDFTLRADSASPNRAILVCDYPNGGNNAEPIPCETVRQTDGDSAVPTTSHADATGNGKGL